MAIGSRTRIDAYAPHLWAAVVAFFVVGDLVTTVVGLTMTGLSEGGPLAAVVYERYGVGALVLMKPVAVAAFYLLWRVVPSPHDVGVPIALAAVGVLATAWNSLLLSGAL